VRSTWLLLLSIVASASAALARPADVPRPAVVTRTGSFDVTRRIDANRINMFVTNVGSWANDILNFNYAGLFYPKGTSRTVVYESGLWLGARVLGETRATISEYSQEYSPGPMVGGTYSDPNDPVHRVYKVARFTGDPADTAHVERTAAELAADPTLDPLVHDSWSEYMGGAAPFGAPWKLYALPDGAGGTVEVPGPDVLGDQMLWCVYNDADPSRHVNLAGRSAPLGVEVQQTTFGYSAAGPLGNVVFLHFHITNKGGQALDSLIASLWSDPDVGGAGDDLLGSDAPRAMGYCYNGTNNDAIYGSSPPAVGVDLLQPGRANGFFFLIKYYQPTNASQSYNVMLCRTPYGAPTMDPTTGMPSTWYAQGDPLTWSGWLDANPSDRVELHSYKPVPLLPGQSLDLWTAIVVGHGADRLASIAYLRCVDDAAQQAFDQGFPADLSGIGDCSTVTAPVQCPRTPGYYADECSGAGHLTSQQLGTLSAFVTSQAISLSPAHLPGGFCAAVADASDARRRAIAEYAALVANVNATSLRILPSGQVPIWLDQTDAATVPNVTGRPMISDLLWRGNDVLSLRAWYERANPSDPAPFAGFGGGLTAYDGGIGYAWDFFGSSLDPSVAPDSFHTVELRYDPGTVHHAYRYLRLETANGGSPVIGRVYRYAGYVEVPFAVRDSVTGEDLDVGFVERAVTDADGTLLPASGQPATFDSTWAPGTDQLGGREYFFVSIAPTTGTARPEYARDGACIDGTLPLMYAAWLMQVAGVPPPAPGDRLVISRRRPQVPGVDSRLLDLEPLPLSDPATVAAYTELADALAAINRGDVIPNSCAVSTAVLASLVSASAQPGRVDLEWALSGGSAVTVERGGREGAWTVLGEADGTTGRVTWTDTDVEPGTRYGYRLALGPGGTAPFAGETWIEVPRSVRLAIRGFTPNPGSGPVAIAFTLPEREHALLEVIDVAGRRVLARDLGSPGPGAHVVPLGSLLPAGIYWLRLEAGRDRVTTRGVLLR
jgi:hypothetical protein